MHRYPHILKTALDRALALVIVVLPPRTAGNGVRPSAPPPPRFTPVNSDVHIVALWGAAPDASAGDATLLPKTASAAPVAPDGALHYSVLVTNATNAAQTLRLTDTLPFSMSYVTASATGGFFYNAATTSLTATHALNAFHGDVITTTGAPPYFEILGTERAQNICQHYFPESDDNAINLAGPFPFRYLGVDYTAITLDSNGFVVPGSANPNPGHQNQHLPDPNAPNLVIAPFWDDLDS